MVALSPHTTRATGTILTAVIYNGDHGNHIANAQALNNAKVEGPGVAVVDEHLAVFDGTSGTRIKDGGPAGVIADDSVTLAKLEPAAANTILMNATDAEANPAYTTISSLDDVGTFEAGVKFLVEEDGELRKADAADIAPPSGGIASVVHQVFTSSGTYTPTTNMVHCIVEVQAPGGGGGGADNVGGVGAGGGGGEYARGVFDAADIGASQSVTIGSVGTAGSNGGGTGGNGGNVSVGALITANGGSGGVGTNSGGSTTYVAGGAGGTGGSGGDLRIPGGVGHNGVAILEIASGLYTARIAGNGGNSQLGSGGRASAAAAGAGSNGANYGGGGGGATSSSGTGQTGGTGGAGVVVITEFVA